MILRRPGPGDAALWRSAVEAIIAPEDRDGRLASLEQLEGALADRRCYLYLALQGEEAIGLLNAYRFPDVQAGGELVYL